jgi:ribosome-associated protein
MLGVMGNPDQSQDVEDLEHGRPSKSARKREASSLQDLGVLLATLPDGELEALELPETLAGAIRELRRLTSHGAQVRQRQYIGKLMRKIDAEPLRAKLADKKRRHDVEIRHFQSIERWRDRLLAEGEEALREFLEDHPHAERGPLERLVREAAREHDLKRPPAAARELFALLRELMA